MSAWAKPGAKCALLYTNPSWADLTGFVQVPVLGVVYTVSEVLICDGEEAIRLVELPNTSSWQISHSPPMFGAPVFGTFRFRPVVPVDPQQDISLFRHHLADAPEPVA